MTPRDKEVKRTFTCTWCRKEIPLRDRSRDHLVARVLSGSDDLNNLVDSCKPCNQERNVVQNFYALKLKIIRMIGELSTRGIKFKSRLRCQIRDFKAMRLEMEELRDAWVRLEISRLGRSYSDALDYSIPVVKFKYVKWPTFDIEATVLERSQ